MMSVLMYNTKFYELENNAWFFSSSIQTFRINLLCYDNYSNLSLIM